MARLATYSIQLLNWISQQLGSYNMYFSSILTARVNCKLFHCVSPQVLSITIQSLVDVLVCIIRICSCVFAYVAITWHLETKFHYVVRTPLSRRKNLGPSCFDLDGWSTLLKFKATTIAGNIKGILFALWRVWNTNGHANRKNHHKHRPCHPREPRCTTHQTNRHHTWYSAREYSVR